MHEAWTVLGGWGVEPEVLQPVFGEHAIYLDTNRLIPHIIDREGLRPDWQERCTALIAPYLRNSRLLAGWSTGAIIALGCCARLQPHALVLISATQSFCRTPEFRNGMHPAALTAMRNKLSTDTPEVLRDFRKRCGLPDAAAVNTRWSPAELAAGLQALAAIVISPAGKSVPPPLFVHGCNDTIIPFAAGEQAHHFLGGRLLALDAPHACFVNNEKTIRSAIDHYLKEAIHESV